MAAAKFSSYRPTSKLWASFCSSLGEAWPRPALCTAARSHAATHGRQFWCWAASRRCARGRYEACNFSLQRHHYQVLVVCLGLQSTGCQMPPTTPMPKTCLRREHIRPQLAPVHRSRRACSHRCAAVAPSLSMASILSRLPPMAWLDGGSRSRSWAPELLLATADKQIRADKGRRAAGTRAKKDLPQKVGRRQSPLLVRAG